MNVLLLEPGEASARGCVVVSGHRAEHLRQVLKVVPGRQIRVGIIDGPLGSGTVVRVDTASVELHCTFETAVPQRPPVSLLLALPRPKVMRRLWAQLAAIGVDRIILTNAARVERQYFDTHVLTPGCYRPLLVEGLQQARDTRLPVVSIHRRFRVLVEDELDALVPSATRLVADPRAASPVRSHLCSNAAQRVLLAVGPEGGWTDFELSLLDRHGFRAVGIGPRTLRTDTACIALLGVVHEALRSCRP